MKRTACQLLSTEVETFLGVGQQPLALKTMHREWGEWLPLNTVSEILSIADFICFYSKAGIPPSPVPLPRIAELNCRMTDSVSAHDNNQIFFRRFMQNKCSQRVNA